MSSSSSLSLSKRRLAEYFIVTRLKTEPHIDSVIGPNGNWIDPELINKEDEDEQCNKTNVQSRLERPELFSGSSMHEAPIVDICIIFSDHGEKIPVGYECLIRTPFGYRGDCNSGWFGGEAVYICFKRAPLDKIDPNIKSVIVDVKLILTNKEKAPTGYDIITNSRSGLLPGNINYGYTGNSIYIAVKRAPIDVFERERYHSIRPLVDMCIINMSKGETVPLGYEQLAHSTNEGNWTGNKMFVCIKRSAGFGMLDIPFAGVMTDRVPETNHVDSALPDEIALCTSPNGVKLRARESTNVPLPEFFSFVLTMEDGTNMHASCLTFYEVLPKRIAEKLERSYDKYLRILSKKHEHHLLVNRQIQASKLSNGSSWTLDEPINDEISPNAYDSDTDSGFDIYTPIRLCILSRYPFHREFKQYLMLLYQILISGTPIPVERYIHQFMYQVPIPKPGSAGLFLRFSSDSKQGVKFMLPHDNGLPMSSVNYETVFRCLSIAKFVDVFSLMLLGSKMILHSKFTSVLGQVAESLRSLMFPFDWQHIYIPVCPGSLAQILDAPVPFLVGIHTELLASFSLSPEIWLVDLDSGEIYCTEVLRAASKESVTSIERVVPASKVLDPNHVVRMIKKIPDPLPLLVSQQFIKSLTDAVKKYAPSLDENLGQGAAAAHIHQNPDFAYSLTPLETQGDALDTLQMAIRDAAVMVTGTLLENYSDFLLAPKLKKDSMWNMRVGPSNINDIFDIKKFLASVPKTNKVFMAEFVKTLHFTKFIEDRTFSSSAGYRFLFFDGLIEELRRARKLEQQTSQRSRPPSYVGAGGGFMVQASRSSGSSSGIKTQSGRPKVGTGNSGKELTTDRILARYRQGNDEKDSALEVVDAGGIFVADDSIPIYKYDAFPALDAQLILDPDRGTSSKPLADQRVRAASVSAAKATRGSSVVKYTSFDGKNLWEPKQRSHSWNTTPVIRKSHSASSASSTPKSQSPKKATTPKLKLRYDSSTTRLYSAGVRVHDEKQLCVRELVHAKSTKDRRWAMKCTEQIIGAWLCMLPPSVMSGCRPNYALAIALAQIQALRRKFGEVLDQASIRSLLASIAQGCNAFIPEGHTLYQILEKRQSRANAATYGFFTSLLSKVNDQQTWKMDAKNMWKRVKNVLMACAKFKLAGRGKLEPLPADSQKENYPEAVLWCMTVCPSCKSKLTDDYITAGWEADAEQIAHKCPFCQFLVVPRLNYAYGELRGQVEYMNPLVFRSSMESFIQEMCSGNACLDHESMRSRNPALYVNVLWFTTRMNLGSLFGDKLNASKVECIWDGEAYLKYPELFNSSQDNDTIQEVSRRFTKDKSILRRYEKPEMDIDSWKFVVTGLKPTDSIERNTIWGNATIMYYLQSIDVDSYEDIASPYVDTSHSPLDVICMLLYFVKHRFLQNAVFLFLSARIASRLDEGDPEAIEYGNGFFVTRGWEVFSNSVFLELYAIARVIPGIYSNTSDFEESLRLSMNQTFSSNATLASYLTIQDFPPDRDVSTFRLIFPMLYP